MYNVYRLIYICFLKNKKHIHHPISYYVTVPLAILGALLVLVGMYLQSIVALVSSLFIFKRKK